MTPVLSCFVTSIALAAAPGLSGLPLGIPPMADDTVISHVAPPQCLFYVDWAGTASPGPDSPCETEKLLAEPEVQEFLKGLGHVFQSLLKQLDEEKMPAAVTVAKQPGIDVPPQEIGNFLALVLTRPTAVVVTDVKVPLATPDEKAEADTQPCANEKSETKEESTAGNSSDPDIQGGMIVSLGPDAARLRASFQKGIEKAAKAGDRTFKPIKIGGETWYHSEPTKPGDATPQITFGFHGSYFAAGMGKGTVEGMLARWNGPTPAWLTKAREQTQVPRRTGIIYLNLKALRGKLLSSAASQKDVSAVLEMLGLDNVDSLVATTGLDEYGMIQRMLLALDGKPRGLLNMVADRPLTAGDLEPIPDNALLAFAARLDLDRTVKVLLAAYGKVAANDADAKKTFEEITQQYGVDAGPFLAAIGDRWCVYNSPTEGEMPFMGWTAVVSVRDRAALEKNWEKLVARAAGPDAKGKDAEKKEGGEIGSAESPVQFRKCHFAGHEIYYVAGQPIAPSFSISDRELVMTLNMPAMKAYWIRKNHRSLATLPGVALALNDANRPVALSYSNTPRLFDGLYPLLSLGGVAASAAAQKAKIDLEPTFWPSALAIRPHLRPDVGVLQRTPHGLQLTSHYSVPTGGIGATWWLLLMGALGNTLDSVKPSLPAMTPLQSGELIPPGIGMPVETIRLKPVDTTLEIPPSSTNPVFVKPPAGNQLVAEQIAAKLRDSGELRDYRVGVRFQDGTAWLRGQVTSEEQMAAALQIAARTPGVKRVVNNLTVLSSDAKKPSASAPKPDLLDAPAWDPNAAPSAKPRPVAPKIRGYSSPAP